MIGAFRPGSRSGSVWVAALVAAALASFSLSGCGDKGGGAAGAGGVATTHFVNSHDDAKSPGLAAHYIDFSFDYPSSWTVDPDTGTATASNFIKVSRQDAAKTDIENFAVGDFEASGNPEADKLLIPQMLNELEGQVAQGFAGYKRVDIGPATVAGQFAQQLRFTASPMVNGKPLNMFGRGAMVPGPAGSKLGVVLVMLATDSGGEFHSVDDVGVKGQLPIILRSFKIGR